MRELRRYSTSTTPMLNVRLCPRGVASEERGASAQVRVHVKLKRGDTVRRRSCYLLLSFWNQVWNVTLATSKVKVSRFAFQVIGKSARSQPLEELPCVESVASCLKGPGVQLRVPEKECASSPRNSLPLA